MYFTGEGKSSFAFTPKLLFISFLSLQGEEVKAKIEKRWTRARIRALYIVQHIIVDDEVFALWSRSFAISGILYWRENGQSNFV